MSGPKIDYAELERRKQAELERQRKERLRQIKMATDELNVQLSIARKNQASVESDSARLISSLSGRSEMQDVLFKISEIKKEHQKKTFLLLNESVPTEADDIRTMAKRVAEKTTDIYKEYQISVKPYIDRMNSFVRRKNEIKNAHSYEISSQPITITQTENFDFRVAISTVEEQANISECSKKRVDGIFTVIENIINSDSVSQKSKKELFKLADALYRAAFDDESSVSAKIVECNMAVAKIQREQDTFESLYCIYYSEYVAYLEIINRTRDNPLKIVPKERSFFNSIGELNSELQLLQELSKTANDQGYIRKQIDEVLQDFGYSTTEEIVLNKTQKDPHIISRKESDSNATELSTGLHIHLSNRGAIMMEVVGIGESSSCSPGIETSTVIRSDELTDSQKEQLLLEQKSFCELHPQIVAELRKRGVNLSEKMHLNPDIQYASVILNYEEDNRVYLDDEEIINIQESDKKKVVRRKLKEKSLN